MQPHIASRDRPLRTEPCAAGERPTRGNTYRSLRAACIIIYTARRVNPIENNGLPWGLHERVRAEDVTEAAVHAQKCRPTRELISAQQWENFTFTMLHGKIGSSSSIKGVVIPPRVFFSLFLSDRFQPTWRDMERKVSLTPGKRKRERSEMLKCRDCWIF